MPLTDVKIRSTKPSDKSLKLTDGGGLYLEVKPNGSKLWRYRYRIAGKENTFAIGAYPDVTLQEARAARDSARAQVKVGVHPSHARQAELARQLDSNDDTFRALALAWIGHAGSSWTPGYLAQVESYMEKDVYPHLGRRPIRSITSSDMVSVVKRVVDRGAPTAAILIRTWCSSIFSHAIIVGKADADPTTALKRMVGRDETDNAQPMSVSTISKFKAAAEVYSGLETTVLALKLLLHTFVRTVELRRATWDQVDWAGKVWVIPAANMKMKRKHIVPLSDQVLAMLRRLHEITGHQELLVPHASKPGEMMGSSTVNHALACMGISHTGHDFRATASTHLNEMEWDERYIEMQLAHVETNKTKKAYNHAKWLSQRRLMMQAWSDWLDAIPIQEGLTRKRRSLTLSSQRPNPSSPETETTPS